MVADCGRGSCFIVDGDLTCKCEAGYRLFTNYPMTACINVNEHDDAATVVVIREHASTLMAVLVELASCNEG